MQFCDMFGNICFENEMQNTSKQGNCKCPNECNSISYSFSFVSTPFDPEKLCPGIKAIKEDSLMKEFYLHKSPPEFMRQISKHKNPNISIRESDICMKRVKYRAEILFRIASDEMSVTVMTRRLSFFDQLSAFGNFLAAKAAQ